MLRTRPGPCCFDLAILGRQFRRARSSLQHILVFRCSRTLCRPCLVSANTVLEYFLFANAVLMYLLFTSVHVSNFTLSRLSAELHAFESVFIYTYLDSVRSYGCLDSTLFYSGILVLVRTILCSVLTASRSLVAI